jgi:hypothetical protein
VATQTKVWVCGCCLGEIAGLNPQIKDVQLLYSPHSHTLKIPTPNLSFVCQIRTLYTADEQTFQGIAQWHCKTESQTIFCVVLERLIPVATCTKAWVYSHLSRLRVRILPGAWTSVSFECCVLSSGGICDGLITHPEESYRMWCV